MELINIYDENRKKTAKIVERHTKKQPKEFDLSVQIWIMNDKEEIILTKRVSMKTFPNLWECTEGLVDSNETSLEAAIREVREELGIEILPEEIVKLKIDQEMECPKYTDIYLCRKNVTLNEISLQKEECSEVKIVNEQEYDSIFEKKEMIPYLHYFYNVYRKNKELGILDMQNQIFIDETKEQLKGNLHTHTTTSDGCYSISETLKIYKDNGYDFLGITDHDIYCSEEMEDEILLIPGVEASCIYKGNDETKGAYVHLNCYCPLEDTETIICSYKDATTLQENITNFHQKYGIVQFNHPLFSKLFDSEFVTLENYQLIEIYNHKDYLVETGLPNAEHLVRTLLNNHKKLWVTAGDDFHGPYEKASQEKCIGGFIMVPSQKTIKDIWQAIGIGKFYASTGPKIYDYRLKGRVLKIKTSPVKNIIFYSNMRNCKNIFEINKEITSGEYVLQGEEHYVWVKIIDKNGHIAWAQPVFVDNNPYF